MATFDYFDNIPSGPNNPSTDQPNMQTNTNSIDGIINVDHYSFEQSNLDGWHKQVTFPANNVAGAQVALASTIYSNVGIDDATKSQLYFRNSATLYPLSLCKAFIVFTIIPAGPPATVTTLNAYNCSVVGTPAQTDRATITINANVFPDSNVGILLSNNQGRASSSYSWTNPTLTFTSAMSAPAVTTTWTVLFLQI